MKKVSQLLSRKGNNVISVEGSATVLDTLKLMVEKNIGSVVITDNGKYIGLLTERDYARKVALMGKSSGETYASEIMSTDLPRITADTSIETCMQLMSDKNIRYLIVFNANNELNGIVSMNDIIYETIHSQRETIEELRNYIQS